LSLRGYNGAASFFFTLALIAEGTAEYQFIMPLFSSKTFNEKIVFFNTTEKLKQENNL
jgi:hypothetical protein